MRSRRHPNFKCPIIVERGKPKWCMNQCHRRKNRAEARHAIVTPDHRRKDRERKRETERDGKRREKVRKKEREREREREKRERREREERENKQRKRGEGVLVSIRCA